MSSKHSGLAISAKRSSGKTFCADKLISMYPKVFGKRISFGTGLKEAWTHMSGSGVPTDGPSKEHWRRYITKFSDKCLAETPGRWCARLKKDFEDARAALPGKLVICDDVRQDKEPSMELTTVLQLGMLPMRIEAPAQVRRDKLKMLDNFEVDKHRSEIGLDNHPYWTEHPDCVIKNNGDEQFMKDVLKFVWDNFGDVLSAAGYSRAEIDQDAKPKKGMQKVSQEKSS